jgi:hypothetical protein
MTMTLIAATAVVIADGITTTMKGARAATAMTTTTLTGTVPATDVGTMTIAPAAAAGATVLGRGDAVPCRRAIWVIPMMTGSEPGN